MVVMIEKCTGFLVEGSLYAKNMAKWGSKASRLSISLYLGTSHEVIYQSRESNHKITQNGRLCSA